jgi:hypothetical protein
VTLRQNANPRLLANGWNGRRGKKYLLRGMLSLEEIKEWADTIEAQSTSNLIKFCHSPAKPAHRAVIKIVFADGVNEYRVSIFPEFNIIYVDVFHKGVEADITTADRWAETGASNAFELPIRFVPIFGRPDFFVKADVGYRSI